MLSNLTIFGYPEFLQHYREYAISYDFAYKPNFMAVYVLDDHSKEEIKSIIDKDPVPWKEHIYQSLNSTPSDLDINNLKIFLKEFTRRRDIDITSLYPKTFINWINGD